MTHPAPAARTRLPFVALTLALVGAMAGCAATRNLELERLETELQQIRSDAAIARRAPSAVEDAVEAVSRAALAEQEGLPAEEIEHRIYLGHRRLDIARAQSSEKAAEEEIALLGADRDRIVANARTLQSDRRAAAARDEIDTARARTVVAEERASAAGARLEAADRLLESERARAREVERSNAALAARLETLREELGAVETERGLLFTLGGDILFDVGRSDLRAGAHQRLGRLAAFLADYPTRRIRIEGYTDSTGSADTNRRLSTARADAVRRAFLDEGISSARIEAYGNGASSPIASNYTREGRQQNRRVEVLLTPDADEAMATSPSMDASR